MSSENRAHFSASRSSADISRRDHDGHHHAAGDRRIGRKPLANALGKDTSADAAIPAIGLGPAGPQRLEREVRLSPAPPLLVAHSLACLLVAHWQQTSVLPVAGAFLVAVPDPRSESFPQEACDFIDPPAGVLRMPSLIVASSDDPFGTPSYARERAEAWGSGLVDIGAAGHVNGESGLGDWPDGMNLLTAFATGLAAVGR